MNPTRLRPILRISIGATLKLLNGGVKPSDCRRTIGTPWPWPIPRHAYCYGPSDGRFLGCLKPPKLPRWVPRSGMGIFGGVFWDLASIGFTGDLDGLSAPGRKLRLYISPAKRRSRGMDARTRLKLSLFLCCSLFHRKGWGQSPQYGRSTFLIKIAY